MPPKTRGSTANKPSGQRPQDEDEDATLGSSDVENEDKMSVDEKDYSEDNNDDDDDEEDDNPKKRKSPPTESTTEPDTKATKHTRPQDASDQSHQPKDDANVRQILNFLLSEAALPLCYPSQELEAGKDGSTKTYALTPPCNFTAFEQLVTAHMLSKPLSHVLGMRSIRTLLNPPYALSTPTKIVEAGEKRVWEALEEARTQHRQKTASYLYQLAQTYEDDDIMLALAEEANEQGAAGVVEHIKETVHGMGQTGAEIFCRRIQCVDGWGEAVWPYADPKTLDALKQLGVDVADGNELQDLVERYVDWKKVGQMGLRRLTGTGRDVEIKDDTADGTGKVEEMDYEQRVQVEFVVLLERAVGAVLEGNAKELKSQAAAT